MDLTFDDIKGWSDREARERLSSSSDEEVATLLRIAAEAGVAEAQALYGQVLLDGKGTAKDDGAALRWFSKAAQKGHAMAMNMVGRCCEQGWGTRIDKALAAQWYGAAAKRGLDWGMYNLATLHCLGEGVALDRAEALLLFEGAAAQGHVKSITMVGGFHEDGWVVPRNMGIAADHYRRAAEGGDFRGMFNHVRMLIEDGRPEEAITWLRRLPANATPTFLTKTSHWLAARPEAALREIAAEMRAAAHQPPPHSDRTRQDPDNPSLP